VTDIPGSYIVKYSFGDELRTIERGGEFTQIVRIKGSDDIRANGNWLYDQRTGQITLRNHIMVHDGYGGLNPKLKDPSNRWNSVLAVKSDIGNGIVIVASADGAGFDYRRTK